MHKEMRVTNTGHGVHVHAKADDDVGSIDFKVDIKLNDKAHAAAAQAAWKEAEVSYDAADKVPDAIRGAFEKIVGHVADMEQKVEERGG